MSKGSNVFGDYQFPANPMGFRPELTPMGSKQLQDMNRMSLSERFDQAFGLTPGGRIDVSAPWDKTATDMRLLDSLAPRVQNFMRTTIMGQLKETDNDVFRLGIFRVEERGSIRDVPVVEEEMVFNQHDLQEVPVFGVAPGLTSQMEKSTGMSTRVGIRFQMERAFMKEPEGIMVLLSYLRVVQLAVERWLLSCAWRAILTACDQRSFVAAGHIGAQFGLPMSQSSFTSVMDYIVQVHGILCRENGLAALVNIATMLFMERGMACTALAVPAGTIGMVSNMAFKNAKFLPVKTLDGSSPNSILANKGMDFVNQLSQGVRIFESPFIPDQTQFHDPTKHIRAHLIYTVATERCASTFNNAEVYQSDDTVPGVMDWQDDDVSMIGGGKRNLVASLPIWGEAGALNDTGATWFEKIIDPVGGDDDKARANAFKAAVTAYYTKENAVEYIFFASAINTAITDEKLPETNWFSMRWRGVEAAKNSEFTKDDAMELIGANIPWLTGVLAVRADMWAACSSVAFATTDGGLGTIYVTDPEASSWFDDDRGVYTAAPVFRASVFLGARASQRIIIFPATMRRELVNGGKNHVFDATDRAKLDLLRSDPDFDPGWMCLPLEPGEDPWGANPYLPLEGNLPAEIDKSRDPRDKKLPPPAWKSCPLGEMYGWGPGKVVDPSAPFASMVSASTGARSVPIAMRAHSYYATVDPITKVRNRRGRIRRGKEPLVPGYPGLSRDCVGFSCNAVVEPPGGVPHGSICF
jgi:hypothetical protein